MIHHTAAFHQQFIGNILFGQESFFAGILYSSINTLFVDGPESIGGNLQGDPFILFRDIKSFCMQVRIELPPGFYV